MSAQKQSQRKKRIAINRSNGSGAREHEKEMAAEALQGAVSPLSVAPELDSILHLQRVVGNQAVQRMLSNGATLASQAAQRVQLIQRAKKTKSARKHEQMLLNQAKQPTEGPGSVRAGAKSFDCLRISYNGNDYISANFSPPYPTPEQLTTGAQCTITIGVHRYSANLYQIDRHPTGKFLRANFDTVTVKG